MKKIFSLADGVLRFLILTYFIGIVLFAIFLDICEAKIPIAVVDTGIRVTKSIQPYLCKESVDLTGYGIYDVHGHGTNVAHILARYVSPKTHCLYIIKWYHNAAAEQLTTTSLKGIFKQGLMAVRAMQAIKESRARYVNMSLAGTLSHWKERMLMRDLLRDGVIFAVAAGNDGLDLSVQCDSFPACYGFPYPNFYVVGGSHHKRINYGFNHGGPVDIYEQSIDVRAGGITLSGTSQATPIFLGKYIRKRTGRAPAIYTWSR